MAAEGGREVISTRPFPPEPEFRAAGLHFQTLSLGTRGEYERGDDADNGLF
jgi:hypothetical protein